MDILLLTTLVSVAVLLATCFCLWLLKRQRQQGLFRKYGIPGPKPELLYGNWKEFIENRLEVMESWIEEHGRVFGFYQGERPYMVLTDVDMIKVCFLKETNAFADRPPLIVAVEPFVSSIVGLTGVEWKKVRSVLNPIFTPAKMKMMADIMNGCTDEMMEVLEENLKKSHALDMFQISQGLSLDVIAKCSLAWKVDCQKNPTDPLLVGVRKIFEDFDNSVLLNSIRFPIVRKMAEQLCLYSSYYKITTEICENVRNVIEQRRRGQSPRTLDMLQLMLDAQAGKESDSSEAGEKKRLIEDRHLLSNCFLFLAAGFETTAASLAFVLYVLAKHPEEQERILEEITAVFPDGQELTYDGVQRLKRLDAVIWESMRLYPAVVFFVERHCKEDINVMGQFFPAGVNVVIPTWHIHHDPELWPDPYKFDPERFSDGPTVHHPASFIPFGLGPRVCIGKRFALFEIKMAVSKIIRKYRMLKCDKTQDPLRLVVPSVTLNPEDGIWLSLEPRRN